MSDEYEVRINAVDYILGDPVSSRASRMSSDYDETKHRRVIDFSHAVVKILYILLVA